MRDWCVGMLKKCWLNAREAQWNEWVLKKKNLLTTFGTFFFYLLQCLVANVMVFCGGHSRGKNNCKCFVCSVHMLFAERERECPTYLVLNQTLWTVWHFVLLESANLAGLAVWSEPGKLPATLVRIAASFVFHHWSVFRFHLLHQDSTHPWLHSNSCNVSTYDR